VIGRGAGRFGWNDARRRELIGYDGRDFDFWVANASEMKQLADRIRAVSQLRLDQLSK
jgi:hypothetical protein